MNQQLTDQLVDQKEIVANYSNDSLIVKVLFNKRKKVKHFLVAAYQMWKSFDLCATYNSKLRVLTKEAI